MQRERVITRWVDGQQVLIPIRFYAGITLIDAKDKTTKPKRKGNYWVPVTRKSGNGVIYKSVIPIDKFNYMHQAGRVSQLPKLKV